MDWMGFMFVFFYFGLPILVLVFFVTLRGARALSEKRRARDVDSAVALLRDPNVLPESRVAAFERLVRAEACTPALLDEVLEREDPFLLIAAMQAVRSAGMKEVLPKVHRVFQRSHCTALSYACLEVILDLGDASALRRLEAHLDRWTPRDVHTPVRRARFVTRRMRDRFFPELVPGSLSLAGEAEDANGRLSTTQNSGLSLSDES